MWFAHLNIWARILYFCIAKNYSKLRKKRTICLVSIWRCLILWLIWQSKAGEPLQSPYDIYLNHQLNLDTPLKPLRYLFESISCPSKSDLYQTAVSISMIRINIKKESTSQLRVVACLVLPSRESIKPTLAADGQLLHL